MTQKIKFQLYEMGTNQIISDTGGFVYVAKTGDAQKETLKQSDGSSQSNGLALTNGAAEFYVADTVTKVDLYIMAPGGEFIVRKNVYPGETIIYVDTSRIYQCAVIPFSIQDTTATTETDTGFDFPLNTAVLPNPVVRVTTIDAGQTIDVGLKSSETNGDADGFIDGVSLATAILVKATLTSASDTFGALLSVQDSANAGDDAPEAHIVQGANAVSITYTLDASTDTAEGFVYLPYLKAA